MAAVVGLLSVDADSMSLEGCLNHRALPSFGKYSRRLELARAAAIAPSFMLLDEPTSGMSNSESLTMIEQVRHMAATVGAGVIVIDHDLGFITGISDRIYVFDQGQVIAEGTPTEVQADPRVQAAYLGSAAVT